MTVFDYVLLGIAFLHFCLTVRSISKMNAIEMHYAQLSSMWNIWWVAPLIVIYRVWG